MKTNYLPILLILILPLLIFAEQKTDKFLYANTALGYGHVKDIGTSPLRYHGLSGAVSSGYIQNSSTHNFELLGSASTISGLVQEHILNYLSASMNIAYTHSLPVNLGDNTQLNAGADFYASMNFLLNPSYQNASFNLDFLIKLALRAQIQHRIDIQPKTIRIAGIKFNIKKQSYTPFYRIDIPALIFNGRPKHAYVNESDLDVFDRHYFFGGCNIKTQLGIKKHLNNGNLLELAYIWQMGSTGKKDIYPFEHGSHDLAFSLYFKLN